MACFELYVLNVWVGETIRLYLHMTFLNLKWSDIVLIRRTIKWNIFLFLLKVQWVTIFLSIVLLFFLTITMYKTKFWSVIWDFVRFIFDRKMWIIGEQNSPCFTLFARVSTHFDMYQILGSPWPWKTLASIWISKSKKVWGTSDVKFQISHFKLFNC